jgi:hypothetical protein
MNIVTPIVVPMGGGIRGGGGSCSEVVNQAIDNAELFLGVPWLIFFIISLIMGSLFVATDNRKIADINFRFTGWGATVLGTYTLIYVLYYLVRYLIER